MLDNLQFLSRNTKLITENLGGEVKFSHYALWLRGSRIQRIIQHRLISKILILQNDNSNRSAKMSEKKLGQNFEKKWGYYLGKNGTSTNLNNFDITN